MEVQHITAHTGHTSIRNTNTIAPLLSMESLEKTTVEQKIARQKENKKKWYAENKARINKNRRAKFALRMLNKNANVGQPHPAHHKTVKEYALLCGVSVGAIKDRIRRGLIIYEKETFLIDIEKYPPIRLKKEKPPIL